MAKDMKYIRKRKRKYGSAFIVDIPYKDSDGNPKHFTETVKVREHVTEAAALLYAQRVRNEALQGISAGKLRKVFPTVGSLYEKKFDLMPLAISTRDKQNSVYAHSIGMFADVPLDQISAADIQTCVNQYAENHSDDSIQRCVSIWRQIYKVATILEYDIPDKTTAIVIPKSKYRRKRKDVAIQPGEFETVLSDLLASGEYNDRGIYYMLQIMYFTGCRPAEALALRREDIHETYISINKQIGSTTHERRKDVPTKTEESTRRVPVSPALRPILDEMIEWSSFDLLLADGLGNARNISLISDRLNYISKKHGMNFFSYKLRHQMSSDLMALGNPVAARDILGHTSFGMTLDYARSTDDQLFDAIKNRKPAENQPKNNRLEPPPTAVLRHYSILRLNAAISLISLIKSGFFAQKKEPECSGS